MKNLASAIAAEVRALIANQLQNLQTRQAEMRAVFNGPPQPFLRDVYDELTSTGGIQGNLADGTQVAIPILLLQDPLPPGMFNPPIGVSGICDQIHVLDLRNSPQCPRFLVLSPPGSHPNLSQNTTWFYCGVAPSSQASNAAIKDWYEDDFIDSILAKGLEVLRPNDSDWLDRAKHLAHASLDAADAVNNSDGQRVTAWKLISRIWSIVPQADVSKHVCLACGFAPSLGDSIPTQELIHTFKKLADTLEEGFKRVIEEFKASSEVESEQRALDYLLQQLLDRCPTPTAVTQGMAFYYGPYDGYTVADPPEWWSALTLERWQSFLEESSTNSGELVLTCTNSIPPSQAGIVPVVADAVQLSIHISTENGETPVQVDLIRESGPATNRKVWQIDVNGTRDWMDPDPPQHKRPLKYTVTAPNLKSASIRVISMGSYTPGIVVCGRDSKNVTPPRQARAGAGRVNYETSLVLRSNGRQYLNIYVGPNVRPAKVAVGTEERESSLERDEAAIARISEIEYGVEIRAASDKTYELQFERTGVATGQTLRIHLSCDDVPAEQCTSEFERLVFMNRARRDRSISSTVHLNATSRSSDLQSWMLENANSFYPLVFGPDYAAHWRKRDLESQTDTIVSDGHFLSDPRPTFEEMTPPAAFLSTRKEIIERIRNHENALTEGAPLGVWMTGNSTFQEILETYLRAYQEWLEHSPTVAAWCDLSIIVSLEDDKKTLVLEPDAVLVSPLHPVKLAWQACAQKALLLSYRRKPCPAASILDSHRVPDSIALPIRSASGAIIERQFFSLESDSDYWSVLWNTQRLDKIGKIATPFDVEFGVQIGGLASSFSTSQVGRSMNDISELVSTKPLINVSVTSAASRNSSTNDGLLEWSRSHFSKIDENNGLSRRTGRRFLRILDQRSEDQRPSEAEISNLAEDTENAVTWYATKDTSVHPPDLTIVAQLEASSMSAAESALGSPLSSGGLLRSRIRQQLRAGAGAFLSESRSSLVHPLTDDALLDRTAMTIARLENLASAKYNYVFAPSVHTLRQALDTSRYVAVSSSSIDPACFLGGWLENQTYLWDYDLPSYSSRAGDSNGYYLLARISDVDRETLRGVVKRLPNCDGLAPETIDNLILEVARRGIPTVRGLSRGDTGAVGDLGLFVAARLMQDEFRVTGGSESFFPIWREDENATSINLLIPVDPFRNYFDDLARVFNKSKSRPDLLLLSIRIAQSEVSGKITPVEVKYRNSSDKMPDRECALALAQAKSFAELMHLISDTADTDDLLLWKLAESHLQIAFLEYGFRVYSAQSSIVHRGPAWAETQSIVTQALLAGKTKFECDQRGRLIVIDGSQNSQTRDTDEDGFSETISLSHSDAGAIVAGDPSAIYRAITEKLQDWEIFPTPHDCSKRQELNLLRVNEVSPSEAQTSDAQREDSSRPQSDNEAHPLANDLTQEATPAEPENSKESSGIVLQVGYPLDAFQPVLRTLNLSDTNLNQLNLGVVGDLGTGKTQLLKSIVYQISNQTDDNKGVKPNILILDYKRDYSHPDFVKATNARVIKPHKLKLNLFDLSQAAESMTPWLDRFAFFSDVLDKIYGGIGPVQRQLLKGAVRSVYSNHAVGASAPTIYDVHQAYQQVTNGRADSVSSIIEEIVDRELFSEDAGGSSAKDFLSGVVVISLDALGQDDRAKNMLVAIMLNLFYENMLKIEKRSFYGANPQKRVIDSFLLVDEADNIMQYQFDVLRKILLQGREFGVGVILASQYLRHFKAGATDYREPLLTWLIHKIPNVLAQDLSALGMTANQSPTAERIKTLRLHECLYKTHNIGGEFIKGMPFYQLLQSGQI